MRNKQVITLFIVGVVLITALGIYHSTAEETDRRTGDDSVTITDSLGESVEIELPVERICTTNTNVAKFMQILGMAHLVTAADETTISLLPDIYGDITDLGKYNTPSGEAILSTGSKLLICQSTARSITNAEELKSQGIQVIRLDCYGETMLEDLRQLVTIFGPSTQDRADRYVQMHQDVVDAVLTIGSEADNKPVFMFEFLSLRKPYSASSELSKIAESIGSTNCIGEIDGSARGSTSGVQPEEILNFDNEFGIDRILIRGTIGGASTASSEYLSFLAIDQLFEDLSAVRSGNVYVIDTDVLSGPLVHVGYVCIAKALGHDIGGLNPSTLVAEFNEEFGFTYDKTEFLFKVGGYS